MPRFHTTTPMTDSATMTTDRENTPTFLLLRQHRAGDNGALETLFLRHYEAVFRSLRVRLHGQPPGCEIEDLVQEAMLAAIEGLEKYEPREDAAWRDWVVTIGWRLFLNRVRDAKTQKREPGEHAESLQTPSGSWRQVTAPASGVIAEVIRSEEKRLMDQCVAQLTGSRRVVILERDYLGREWAEIAQLLNRDVGACQQLHLRTRTKLATMMARARGGNDAAGSASAP